jgi:FtsH-binding integral membrane protein
MMATRAIHPTGWWHVDRRFFAGTALLMLAVTAAGFGPSYYLAPVNGAPSVSLVVHIHATIFTAWMLLYTGQTLLMARGRVSLHRALGIVGAFLIPAVVVSGYCTVILTATADGGVAPRVGPVPILFPLAAALAFAILAGFGLARRRDAGTHKRLMFLATTSLVMTPLARLARMAGSPLIPPVNGMIMSDLLVGGLFLFDWRTRGRIHPATLWAGGALLLSQPIRLWLNGTTAWQSVAAALIG